MAPEFDANKAKRVVNCNRASVCFSTAEYCVNLVGEIEIITCKTYRKNDISGNGSLQSRQQRDHERQNYLYAQKRGVEPKPEDVTFL